MITSSACHGLHHQPLNCPNYCPSPVSCGLLENRKIIEECKENQDAASTKTRTLKTRRTS